MYDRNFKGYDIKRDDKGYTYQDQRISVAEIRKLLDKRPYWAKANFRYEDYDGIVLNKTAISKVIMVSNDDEYQELLKDCLKTKRLLYWVKVLVIDGDRLTINDPFLDYDSVPVNPTWFDGEDNGQTYILSYEFQRNTRTGSLAGTFIDGVAKCPKCNKTLNSASGYTLHLKSCKARPVTENGVIYTCQVCGKKTISKFGLSNHMRSAHPNHKSTI